MLKCDQCNQEIPDRANFCPWCGINLNAGTSEEVPIQKRLIEISQIMNSTLDMDILLEKITESACELTNSETGSTMLYDPNINGLYFKIPLGEKADILRRIVVTGDEPSIAWWVYENGLPVISNDTASDPRFGGAVDKATKFSSNAILCVPIVLNSDNDVETYNSAEVIGIIEVINKLSDPPEFTFEDQRILSILSYQAAIALRNAKAAGDRRNFFINAIEMFISAIESTGFVPPGHCMRVARISMGMAHRLDIKHDDLQNLYYASALHDIGVLDIRCRQAPRVDGGCPRCHTVIGAEMVRPVNLLAKTEPVIYHHHETWDGSGYPDGIAGHEIPLGARIVAVAEAYEQVGVDKDFIAANAGKLFDPEVVDVFMEMELQSV
jgi:hypothetical protein